MPLSDKSVIKSSDSATTIIEYTPRVFAGDLTQQAQDYLERRKQKDFDFRLSDEVSSQTRIAEAERAEEEERVEKRALEKLKDVQEQAYQEAYALGLEEGKTKAFEEFSAHISEQLDQLDQLTKSIQRLKSDLVSYNEAHIMKTVLQLASRVAMREIESDQSIILDVIKQSIVQSQAEDEIVIQVAPESLEFLEELQKETKREFEFIKDVRFEPNDTVTPGGCIIENNYGMVDARIEERIGKLWETLVPAIPKVKEKSA